MEQKQFEATLHDAEIRLRRLKTLYDQWLSGFERLEPTVPRNELDELLQRLKREHIRNTALRFRLQQVSQRYTMFITYWRRIGRQIEEGTYQRDVIRARKLKERNAPREAGAAEDSYDVDVDVDGELDAALVEAARAAEAAASVSAKQPSVRPPASVPAQPPAAPQTASAPQAAPPSVPNPRPAPPPVPPRPAVAARSISPFAQPLASGAPRPPAPPPVPGSGGAAPLPRPPGVSPPSAAAPKNLSDDDVQRIYAKYVAARKNNAERTDNVKLETIEKSLRGMLPQLEKKHAGKKIDFEVVVKDGKVALKPVAK